MLFDHVNFVPNIILYILFTVTYERKSLNSDLNVEFIIIDSRGLLPHSSIYYL